MLRTQFQSVGSTPKARRTTHVVRCFGDLTPEIIEQKRMALKTQFYSTLQRRMTPHELQMMLQPLFKEVDMEVTVIKNKVYVVMTNMLHGKCDEEVTSAVIDIINDWNAHDEFRRFLIKSLTNANRNKIYTYKDEVSWMCPLSIEYVFQSNDDYDDENKLFI
jgi:hypothetical protein